MTFAFYICSVEDGVFHYHIKTNENNQVFINDRYPFDNLIQLVKVSGCYYTYIRT